MTPDSIERELDLPVSPSRVWASLTDPKLLAQWLADEVTLELRPGGEASFRIGDQRRSGWVEEILAPDQAQQDGAGPDEARLAFWWAQDGEPASRVQLTLVALDQDTTRLRIVESRPLEILDLVGIPLPGQTGHGNAPHPGPALIAA